MYFRRFLACLLMMATLLATAGGAAADETTDEKRVYTIEEAEPFAEGDALLHFYVCPLLGADCMILTCSGETMLVDMGRAKQYEMIKGVLDELGIERIDYAFSTHPHDDHLGSMKQIAQDYEIGQFMTAFPEDIRGTAIIQISTIKAVREHDIPIVTIRDGTTFTVGDAKLTVIRSEKKHKLNAASCMLMVEYGDCRMLLAADVIGIAQQLLSESKELKADILKWPHHGLNKVYNEFLEDVNPEHAIITHGYWNTRAAQEQMRRNGITHSFATWGVIHLSTNGEYWILEQDLTEEGLEYAEKYGNGNPES